MVSSKGFRTASLEGERCHIGVASKRSRALGNDRSTPDTKWGTLLLGRRLVDGVSEQHLSRVGRFGSHGGSEARLSHPIISPHPNVTPL